MTVKEAREYSDKFLSKNNATKEEEFLFTEAMNFLIEKEQDPRDMVWLGSYYYEKREFDLAFKYYERAASYDHDTAYECLGYIWYYGRTGVKDYEKAYKYFSRLMEKGNATASYKIADMYKNGCFVEKDYDKFTEIIEDLYDNKVTTFRSYADPFPEISVRLAEIRTKQGDLESAVELYIIAKDFLARRISYNPFFGNIDIMNRMMDELYKLIDFDYEEFDFYDLCYLLKCPHTIKFDHGDTQYLIEVSEEDDMCAICFNGKWYRDRNEFFEKAVIGEKLLTSIYEELYGWEVIR